MSEAEIETPDVILSRVAKDGSMNYTTWPGILTAVISRIEHIAHHEFQAPRIPPAGPPARAASPRRFAPPTSSDPVEASGSSGTTPSSQETNKENASPSSLATRIAASNAVSSFATAIPATGDPPVQQEETNPGNLPPQVIALLNEITSTLTEEFANYPPHTIQRLAELLLKPKEHYRHLVAYLHALDRVVHVTSGANTYPLPPAVPDMSSMSGVSNAIGNSNTSGLVINSNPANNASDELGGARLSQIPWMKKKENEATGDDSSDPDGSSPPSLSQTRSQQQAQPPQLQTREPQLRTESTETIEGPNGKGSIETVIISRGGACSSEAGTVLYNHGVGEAVDIFRQVQRGGIAASSQQVKSSQHKQENTSAGPVIPTEGDGDSAMPDNDYFEDDVPRLRGPQQITPEETGPQPTTQSRSTRGPDGAVEVEGIDVKATVGRKQSTLEDAILKSTKHEATDKLESPAKRRESEGEDGLAKFSFDNTEEQPKDSREGSALENPTDTPKQAPSDSAPVQEKAAPQSGQTMDTEEPQSEEAKSNTEQYKMDEPMTGTNTDEEGRTEFLEPDKETVGIDHSDAILGQTSVAE